MLLSDEHTLPMFFCSLFLPGLGGESDMVCKLLLSLPGRLELERCLSGSLLTPVTQMMSTLTEWLCIKLSYGKVSLHVTSDSEARLSLDVCQQGIELCC